MKNLAKQLTAFSLVLLIFTSCKKKTEAVPLEAQTFLNVAYGSGTLRTMDVYLPANRTSNTSVIVFVHGGSFIGGDKNDYTILANELVKKDFAVLNINYPLVDATGLYDSPTKHQKSAVLVQNQVADVGAVVDYAISKAKEWQVSESKIALAGHSAGATLALLYTYGNQNTNKVKVVANLAGALDQTFIDIPNYSTVLPSYILEAGYRYTGFEVNPANDQYYKAISPLYVANAGKKIPTLTIFPELNSVGGLPKQDRNTFNAFTTQLNNLGVPNKFVQIAGASHELSRVADLVTVMNELVAYFNSNLK